MKLMIQHIGIRSTDELDASIEEAMLPLEPQINVEEAVVALAHHPERSPRFRAAIHLTVPGPDLHVRAEDHTARAAFKKAMKQIHQHLDVRNRRRASNARGRRQKTAHSRYGLGRGGS